MNSWQSGRRELLEEIAKIYDKIGVNLETGKAPDQISSFF
jgi:hypothetical protein